MTDRRRFLIASAALALAPHARAQAATRMLVGFPPGGVVDITARALADGMRGPLASSIVVENRAGAGGRIAVEAVKAAAPDGQTLLYSPPSMFTVYPHIDTQLRYDPFADFIPVSTVCGYPFALAVAPNLPVRDLQGFLAWAKANPQQASYGSPGAGTIQSFIGAMLGRAASVPMTHVPYKGGAQSINDVMSGALASSVSVAQLFTANHKAGKLRVIAVSGRERLASLAGVPTFAEAGFPQLTFEEWFGVFLPARAANETVARVYKAVVEAVASSAVKEALAKLDYVPGTNAPQEYAAMLRSEHARWGQIVKDSGFKPA
jgi:tripartite-type tricarboxylate transporter receptor subunit TctC